MSSKAAAPQAQSNTGLTMIPKSQYVALAGTDKDLAEAMASVAGTETFGPGDLIRIKMPSGGAVKWEVPDGLGNADYVGDITGVLCYVQQAGVLWPHFEPQPGGMPVLRTFDLKTAEQVGPIPDDMIDTLEKHRLDERHFNWEALPYNQFGSGKNGRGKRCREQRLLFILRPNDIYPLVVGLSPGSLKVWKKFFMNVAAKARVPYWRAVVELKLEKARSGGGQDFARVLPRLVGVLSAEDGVAVKAQYTDRLSQIARTIAAEEAGRDGGEDEE